MTIATPPAAPRIEDFERLLFESARGDQAPEASRRRVANALGIAPGAPLGSALDPQPRSTTAPSEGAAETPDGAAPATPAQLTLFGKAALVGLGGVAIALGFGLFSRSEPVSVAAVPAVAEAAALAETPAIVASAAPVSAPSRVPDVASSGRAEPAPAPPARRAGSKRAPNAAPSRATQPRLVATAADDAAGSRLLAEVQRLDAARDALAAADAKRAMRELARYEREFPEGTLALDAALLEVRALDRSGQRAAAHHRARQLLAQPGAERHRSELEAIVNPLASGGSMSRRRDIGEAR